jgi:hypothetical protein
MYIALRFLNNDGSSILVVQSLPPVSQRATYFLQFFPTNENMFIYLNCFGGKVMCGTLAGRPYFVFKNRLVARGQQGGKKRPLTTSLPSTHL